jgi:hypothetical integral membrane protein (TIGR02206 family)
MSQFFVKDYTGAPFVLFGLAHLVALLVVVVVNILIVANRKRFTQGGKRNFRVGLATVLILNEVGWHLWNYFTGQWTLQTMLPLHLCSVLVWVSAYMLITGNDLIYEFSYFLGIAGATQALLTPDAGIYGFPHFRFLQSITSHGSIVTAAIYMTAVEGYRPYWRSLLRVAVLGNIYMGVIGLVNWVLGSNYLFIAHKPETASLIDVLGSWPWYILSLEALAAVLCLLLYLPFAIRDRKAKMA